MNLPQYQSSLSCCIQTTTNPTLQAAIHHCFSSTQGPLPDGQGRKTDVSKGEDHLIEDLRDQLGHITGLDTHALQSVLVTDCSSLHILHCDDALCRQMVYNVWNLHISDAPCQSSAKVLSASHQGGLDAGKADMSGSQWDFCEARTTGLLPSKA